MSCAHARAGSPAALPATAAQPCLVSTCGVSRSGATGGCWVPGAGGAASGSSPSSALSAVGELLRQHCRSWGQVSFRGVSSLLKGLVLSSHRTLVGSVICCGFSATSSPRCITCRAQLSCSSGVGHPRGCSRHTRKCKYRLTCFVPLLQDKTTERTAEAVSAAPVS